MDLFYDHLALRVLLFLRERIEVTAIIVKAISLKPFATTNRTGSGMHDSERPGEDAPRGRQLKRSASFPDPS